MHNLWRTWLRGGARWVMHTWAPGMTAAPSRQSHATAAPQIPSHMQGPSAAVLPVDPPLVAALLPEALPPSQVQLRLPSSWNNMLKPHAGLLWVAAGAVRLHQLGHMQAGWHLPIFTFADARCPCRSGCGHSGQIKVGQIRADADGDEAHHDQTAPASPCQTGCMLTPPFAC